MTAMTAMTEKNNINEETEMKTIVSGFYNFGNYNVFQVPLHWPWLHTHTHTHACYHDLLTRHTEGVAHTF